MNVVECVVGVTWGSDYMIGVKIRYVRVHETNEHCKMQFILYSY